MSTQPPLQNFNRLIQEILDLEPAFCILADYGREVFIYLSELNSKRKAQSAKLKRKTKKSSSSLILHPSYHRIRQILLCKIFGACTPLAILLVAKLRSLKCRLIFPYRKNQTEAEGFEPSVGVNPQRFSRPPLSTTQPRLQLSFTPSSFLPPIQNKFINFEHLYKNSLAKSREYGKNYRKIIFTMITSGTTTQPRLLEHINFFIARSRRMP